MISMTGRKDIMGSMPRLKIKDDIRYRKGSTNDANNCECCLNFTNMDPECAVPSRAYGSCRLIIEHCPVCVRFNRRTRVRSDYTCDRQEYDGRYKAHSAAMPARAGSAGGKG